MSGYRLWPHPGWTLGLAFLWLLLVNSFSLGHWVLGLMLGWLISTSTQQFLIKVPKVRKPLHLIGFMLKVCWDIVIANVQIARLTLGPIERLQPAFIEVPMQIKDEFVLSLLTSVISLTPGTVSAGLNDDHSCLLLHALDAPDEQKIIDEIKQRYEAPLMEIFACSAT